MTVQENLVDCLLRYPHIFPNKWAVYHHWFIVNGCGYDWKNGELVESDNEVLLTTIEDGINYQFKETLSRIKKGESGFTFEINYSKKAIFDCINLEQRMVDFDPQRETITGHPDDSIPEGYVLISDELIRYYSEKGYSDNRVIIKRLSDNTYFENIYADWGSAGIEWESFTWTQVFPKTITITQYE